MALESANRCVEFQIAQGFEGKNLSQLPVPQRFDAVKKAIHEAIDLNAKIEAMPLDLDPHGRGEHLQPWLDGLNRFYRKFLKA